ncbi:DUF895 domain membrane protein [Dermatophagoides pteronyssinus]|uniref:UNC93-like protein MFSD11 n=1 Tax=Dermatophagoides pteronyssinus TaxID=6956 RepID=A0ABQ8ITJ6_DERPT|nr:DUF895 domain membrane protein [Dermatophagoides pteronyssinus]
MDRDLINVLVLGVSFMFLFTSFQTNGFIQGPMIDSINHEYGKDHYGANTFVSMCLIYLIFSLVNWIAPAFVRLMGARLSMIVSGVTYILFIANFLWPQAWLLYIVSMIVGFGAAIIWTAQGYYLTICSNEKTMGRNSGLFWTLFQCSLLFGNIFVYVYFKDMTGEDIPHSTRTITYIVLTIVGTIGIVTMFFLGSPKSLRSEEQDEQQGSFDVLQSIRESFALLSTRRMLLLCVTFWYTGIELSFFSGVFTTALGRINTLDKDGGNAKKFVGLAGMIIGIGEIVGGLIFGILGSKTVRWGRDPIIILGYFVHMISFLLIMINFPPDSTISETVKQSAYIDPNLVIALISGFLLGFADSCFCTQCMSILGTLYADNSAPAFALFKFFQSIACACAFFYTPYFNLYIQLAILAIFASMGTLSFVIVEWKLRQQNDQQHIN